MSTHALIAASLGLLLLSSLLLFMPPRTLSSPAGLSLLVVNQKITSTSAVRSERLFPGETRLTLANGIEVRCSCPSSHSFKGKSVRVTGTLQRYRNQTWLEAHTLAFQGSP